MRLFILLALLIITCGVCHAQTDTITIKKRHTSQMFLKNGKQLNPKQLKKYVQSDPLAKKEFGKAEGVNVVAQIFGGIGGGLIGYDVGYALGSGGKITAGPIIVGLALIGISIPINISAQKHYRHSVELYNMSRHKTASLYPTNELKFVASGNSFGLTYSFR